MNEDNSFSRLLSTIPDVGCKLEGSVNYREWAFALLKALRYIEYYPLGRYVCHGGEFLERQCKGLTELEKQTLTDNFEYAFQHLITRNKERDTYTHFPSGVLTRDLMENKRKELQEHSLSDRAKFLLKMANLERSDKDEDQLQLLFLSTVHEVTNIENLIIKAIAYNEDKLSLKKIEKVLKHVVQSHNTFREIWKPETFTENVYNFKTDITETVNVCNAIVTSAPFSDNLGSEFQNLVLYFEEMGVTKFWRNKMTPSNYRKKKRKFSLTKGSLKRKNVG